MNNNNCNSKGQGSILMNTHKEITSQLTYHFHGMRLCLMLESVIAIIF